MRIEELLKLGAMRDCARVAIVAGKRRHSYADLALKSDRLAVALQSRGVQRGDRIVVYMDESWEAVVAFFAVLKAGGIVAPVDPATGPEALGAIIEAGRAVGIVTQARLAAMASAAIATAEKLRLVVLAGGDRATATETCISFEAAINRIGPLPALAPCGPDGEPAVAFAGAVPATHRDILAAVDGEDVEDDGWQLPALSDFEGVQRLLTAIKAGATLVLRSHVVLAAEPIRRLMPRRMVGEGSEPEVFAAAAG